MKSYFSGLMFWSNRSGPMEQIQPKPVKNNRSGPMEQIQPKPVKNNFCFKHKSLSNKRLSKPPKYLWMIHQDKMQKKNTNIWILHFIRKSVIFLNIYYFPRWIQDPDPHQMKWILGTIGVSTWTVSLSKKMWVHLVATSTPSLVDLATFLPTFLKIAFLQNK